MKTKLLPFQETGVCTIEEFNGRALLADDMGLGKTLQALTWIYRRSELRPVVIVCPASLKINWAREAAKHLNLAAEVLSGRRPPRSARLTKYHRPILVINYEILKFWVEYLAGLNPQVIIWDEAHYVANRLSQRFGALRQLVELSKAPHRIAISGTPLTNRPADLWPTLFLLRPKKYKSFVEYGFKFCRPKLVHGKWQFTGARNLDKLHEELKSGLMIRRLKKDVMKELPKKVRRIIVLELSKKQREEYNFASTEFIKWIKKRHPGKLFRIMKAPHLTRIGYLLRLALKLKRFLVREWLQNFAQENGEKVIVFSQSRKMIDWLHRNFPNSVIIDGRVTGEKRQAAVDAFQKNRKVMYAFCHPKAAGVGLTLTASSNVVYTDFPYAPGTVTQGEDRIHRIGQTKKCFIWYLAAVDTIEEFLCELLMSKQHILDEVLDGKKKASDLDVFEELLKYTNKKGKLK